jgi:hypothetical protein
MAQYYVYTMGPDRHIVARAEMECPSDQEAIARVKQLLGGHDLELWEKARFIRSFRSQD